MFDTDMRTQLVLDQILADRHTQPYAHAHTHTHTHTAACSTCCAQVGTLFDTDMRTQLVLDRIAYESDPDALVEQVSEVGHI